MKNRITHFLSVVVAHLFLRRVVRADRIWIPQSLGNPYEGQYTGIDWYDLNDDGYPDLLVSAGKHWVDQSYVLINLGSTRFSDPLPLGPPGAYYSVTVGQFSFGTGVLLSGADCTISLENQFGSCTPGTSTPALLLQVQVSGCSVSQPNAQLCQLDWNVRWQDPSHQGDRNGALAYNLGNGVTVDPALVLVGAGGVKIFEPPYSSEAPTFTITPADKLRYQEDAINRGTGLAVGDIGTDYTGFFVGTRTTNSAPPAPIVGVWKTGPSQYDWYNLGNANNEYLGNRAIAVQATGLVLEDLNGDGIPDLVEANHVSGLQRVEGFPVQQDYYILNKDGFGRPATFSWEATGGRSVDAGNLFSDNTGPDLVLGTSNGEIVWFENLGSDAKGNEFLGFEERHRIMTVENCEVRSVKIVPNLLRPCTSSVVAAVYCVLEPSRGGVFAYHDTTSSCPTESPTHMPTPTQPTSAPIEKSVISVEEPSNGVVSGVNGDPEYRGDGQGSSGEGIDRVVESSISSAVKVSIEADLALLLFASATVFCICA